MKSVGEILFKKLVEWRRIRSLECLLALDGDLSLVNKSTILLGRKRTVLKELLVRQRLVHCELEKGGVRVPHGSEDACRRSQFGGLKFFLLLR